MPRLVAFFIHAFSCVHQCGWGEKTKMNDELILNIVLSHNLFLILFLIIFIVLVVELWPVIVLSGRGITETGIIHVTRPAELTGEHWVYCNTCERGDSNNNRMAGKLFVGGLAWSTDDRSL